MTAQLSDSFGGAPSYQEPATSPTATSVTGSAVWPIELTGIYTTHFDRFVSIAQRIVQDRSLAEECVQDVFLAYRLKQPSHDPSRTVGYLRTMVRNAAINTVRSEVRHRRHVSSIEPVAVSVEETALANVWAEELANRVAELPKRQLQVIDCRLNGMSVGETADVLDISSGTVKTHRFRAAAALRDDLNLPAAA